MKIVKPAALTPLTLLMCFFNVCGFVFVDLSSEIFRIELAVAGIIVAVSFVVLYYFWSGRYWARILVLLTSILAVVNLFQMGSLNALERAIILAEAILGLYLLYWLNTSQVKNFFDIR